MNEWRKARWQAKASWRSTLMVGFVGSIIGLGSTIGHAAADDAADQRCAKGDEIRRIEIRFEDDDGRLPCRVIYRPETETETVGIVSWQNIASVEACREQSKEVVQRLTDEGWTCAADLKKDRQDLQPETAASDLNVDPSGGETVPPDDVRPADALAPSAADAASESEADVDRDTIEELVEDVDQPARLVANPAIAPPSEELVSLIEDDLDQLDSTLDGLLEAKIAGYGDLNADDIDDALVVLTYASPQPAYRQYLAVYVYDGEAYQLTATKPVGGSANATMNAEVEAIDRGVVHLRLEAYEPGDPSCCPSGERRLALALRDLDLIEIDADAPTR